MSSTEEEGRMPGYVIEREMPRCLKRVLVRAIAAALVAAAAGGPAAAHATMPGANGRLAFVSNAGGRLSVDTIEPGGGGRATLAPSGQRPAWSPDGRWLAFDDYSIQEYRSVIKIAAADGSGVVELDLPDAPGAYDATWAPDGRRLAISDGGDIKLVDIAGFEHALGATFVPGAAVPVTDGPGFDADPAWSPDGGRIAFQRQESGAPARIATVPAGGGAVSDVARGTSPSWSPDGTRLAFAGPGEQGQDILVVDAAGGEPVHLAGARLSERTPSWSPDGRSIAFAAAAGDFVGGKLWTMAADGSGARQVTAGSADESSEASIDWQPLPVGPPAAPAPPAGPVAGSPPPADPEPLRLHNGRLAFVSDRDGDGEIFTMNPGGGELRQLTRNGVSDQRPAWSPPGSPARIAFDRGGGIWTMRADGSDQRRLTGARADRDPTWSPDGSEIAFTSERSGRPAIWAVGAGGGQPRRISPDDGTDYLQPMWDAARDELVAARLGRELEKGFCRLPPQGGAPSCRQSRAFEQTPAPAPAAGSFGSALYVGLSSATAALCPEGEDLARGCVALGEDGLFVSGVHETPGNRFVTPGIEPVAAPDGSAIAFTQVGARTRDIAILSRPGGTVRPLTLGTVPGRVNGAQADWQARLAPLGDAVDGAFGDGVDVRIARARLLAPRLAEIVIVNRNLFWVTGSAAVRRDAEAAVRRCRRAAHGVRLSIPPGRRGHPTRRRIVFRLGVAIIDNRPRRVQVCLQDRRNSSAVVARRLG